MLNKSYILAGLAAAAAAPSAAKSASNSNPARVHVPIPKDTRNRLVSGIFISGASSL